MLVVPPIDQSSKRVRWQDMANVSVPSVANTSTFAPNGMFTNENVLGLGAYAQPHGRYNVPIDYKWRVQQFKAAERKNYVNEMETDALIVIRANWVPRDQTELQGNEVLALGLPQFHLYAHQEVLDKPEENTLEDFADKWLIAGIIKSGPVLKGNEGQARTIVVWPTGMSFIRNIWGTQAQGGDFLFLVWKEVEVDTETAYVTNIAGEQITRPGIARTGKDENNKPATGLVRYVPRLCPVISDNPRTPKMADLIYIKDCRECYGIPRFVGMCDVNPAINRGERGVPIDATSMSSPVVNMRSQVLLNKINVWVSTMH